MKTTWNFTAHADWDVPWTVPLHVTYNLKAVASLSGHESFYGLFTNPVALQTICGRCLIVCPQNIHLRSWELSAEITPKLINCSSDMCTSVWQFHLLGLARVTFNVVSFWLTRPSLVVLILQRHRMPMMRRTGLTTIIK